MKAVFDTNVLISVFLSDGAPRKVFRKVLTGDVVLLISKALLREFRGVISRKKFGFTKGEVEKMVDLLQEVAYIVEPTDRLGYIKEDPDDNRVLECAVAGGVTYIVTGDRHILDLEEFSGIKIVTASQFLEYFK